MDVAYDPEPIERLRRELEDYARRWPDDPGADFGREASQGRS